MIGKCSGPNSSELGMVLVLPLIDWSVCDLTPWACSFHKMSDTRDDPCSLLPQHPWLCLQLKGQHRQTKRGEEQTFRLVSIRRLIIFCFALLRFSHIAQWLFLVSCCCCLFFFPRTALFFSIWFHVVGSYKAPGKETVVNSSTGKSVCLILYIWGLLKFSALCGGPFHIWTGTRNQLQSRQNGRREWPPSAKMCIVQQRALGQKTKSSKQV